MTRHQELLASTPLQELQGKLRRVYPEPEQLEAAVWEWYQYWQAIGYDPDAELPLFTEDAGTVLENQVKHIQQGRYSGMPCCARSA